VLVTGAGGFIGSHLAEALVRAGARTGRWCTQFPWRSGQLTHVDPDIRPEIEIVAGDVRDRSGMRKAVEGCETVFHLAALVEFPTALRAAELREHQHRGILNVLEACRDCGVGRLVHRPPARSTAPPSIHRLTRSTRCMPEPYAATKIAADQLAYSYHAAFQLPWSSSGRSTRSGHVRVPGR
jgi:dTDP-glucose 4,6-dehydratase